MNNNGIGNHRKKDSAMNSDIPIIITKELINYKGEYSFLPDDFKFGLEQGYSAIVGKNDFGKSIILQGIFKHIYKTSEIGRETYCLISAHRQYAVSNTALTRSLSDYNDALAQQGQLAWNLSDRHDNLNVNQLYAILVQTFNLPDQAAKLSDYFVRLGFNPTKFAKQAVSSDDISLSLHGSGMRCVSHILAALTCPTIDIILIDEPELALEAMAQKALKNLLIEEGTDGRRILVATQSHLFLNHNEPQKNYKMDTKFHHRQVENKAELIEITYNLLGNSLEDLYFPSNFLFVEGASDQTICQKAADLLNIPNSRVKIIAVGGDHVKASKIYEAMTNNLTTLITDDSPYRKKVVVLLDKPQESNSHVQEISKNLGERYFELTEHSIEKYIPEEIYTRAGKNKNDYLKQIEKNKDDRNALREIKKEIALAIANMLRKEDLGQILIITKALQTASGLGTTAQ